MTPTQYVFGYGSLLERHRASAAGSGDAQPAELAGYRRTWNVAMENARTIPGYKYYVDELTGDRGDWFVTFLNVVPDPRATVNGVVFAVSDQSLSRLDWRERNYERVDISDQLAPKLDGRVWVYAGIAVAVRRFERGLHTGRAVVAREYRQRVLDDFTALGPGARDRFEQLTDPPPCPVIPLRRIDVPVARADPGVTPDGERRRGCV